MSGWGCVLKVKKKRGDPSVEGPDDRMLIDAVLGGDKQAYAAIVDRYKNKLYGFFRKMGLAQADAQDLTQETLIRAYRKLASQNPQQSFSGWLHTIAVNLYRDRGRRKIPVPQEAADERPDLAGETPESSLMRSELRGELNELLNTLPEHYRLAMTLRYVGQLSHEEITEITGMTRQQVNNALHRAKQSLRKKIENQGGMSYELASDYRSRQNGV
ncbi:RNA polymerase subunit sigma [Saccharibacillus sp. O16]|nr:RNA polymerase subunit sigma [Saccharibacillus sp. O16]